MKDLLEKLSDRSARVILLITCLVLCNVILACRVIEIAMGNSPDIYYLPTESEKLYKRANIVDRNGRVVAMNLKTASLYANPQQIQDAPQIASKLHEIFPEHSVESLTKKLTAKNQFQWIARHITPKKQNIVNELGAIGLIMIDDIKRIYPNMNNLSHIVGNVDSDNNGISGLEKEFDEFLKYSDVESEQLRLTIDTRIQEIVRKVLISHVKKQDALGGSVIIMDPNSGEVLAMVSAPDYNPNKIANSTDEERFNRNTTGLYEPGSTMKALSVAMAIDSGSANLDGIYQVSQPLKFGKHKIRDFTRKGDELSVPEILMYSSNIGVAKINDEMGEKMQKHYLQKFGFFDRLPIEIAEKSRPMYQKRWGAVQAATVSFGHGIAVSPLHVVTAYTALVNGGYKMYPKFVKNAHRTAAPEQVLSSDTSYTMRKLIRKVVTSGASKKAEVKGYFLGGKTGSAEKNKNGKYLKNANVSSFCGAFPINNPKYLVYVMLDEAKKNEFNRGYTTGGQIAAPLAKDVIENIVGILGLPPAKEMWEIDEELKL